MKIKVIIAIICVVLAAGFALGATGLVRLSDGKVAGTDRLIGVLLTEKDPFSSDALFDSDALDLILSGESTFDPYAYSHATPSPIYAKAVEKCDTDPETGERYYSMDYVFEGIEGIRYFAPHVDSADGLQAYETTIVDAPVSHSFVSFADEVSSLGQDAVPLPDWSRPNLSLNGTIYYTKISGEFLYLNYVYQTPSGDVYAISAGESLATISMPDEYTIRNSYSINGTETNVETKTEIKLTFKHIDPTDSCRVSQFDAENRLLSEETYAADALPESVNAVSGAEYIIAETKCGQGDGAVTSRNLCQKTDDLQEFRVYLPMENGMCEPRSCYINWGE